MKLMPQIKLCVIYKYGNITYKTSDRNDMHIKLTNKYRCICSITKIIKRLIVSQFMYSLGYGLIVCPYSLL